MKPIKLTPVYKDTVWANDHLSQIRGLDDHHMGIAREVCAYKGSETTVAEGPYKGQKITDVIHAHHDEIMGDDPSDQLLRVAFMDSKESLSIQVHPNQEQAEKVNDFEKTESWYVLEAEPGASIVAGVRNQNKEQLREEAENGTLEKDLITHRVKPGDCVLIPAGLIHANGAGMLVVEIGSFGGITYRLYDFGRGRELNLKQGLEITDPSLRTEVTHHPLPASPVDHIETGVDCHLFHFDIQDIASQAEIGPFGYYYVLICVHGECDMECEGEKHHLGYTDTLFVPASSGKVTIKGNCRLLVARYKAQEK